MSDLVELLASLGGVGTVLELDDHGRLVTSGRITPALRLEVEAHRAELVGVVLGRITGHAPGRCDACGAVAIVGVWTASGAKRAAPRCRLTPACPGRAVVAPADLRGVGRCMPMHRGA